MATTSPDNIRTPNPSDPYNLVADLAILGSDVQTALVKRANLYVGTSAQRAAFTTSAPEGVHWQDTNGSKLQYVFQSGAWNPAAIRPGWVCGTAAQRAQRIPSYGEVWQDTDGSKLLWIGSSSGTWRRKSGIVAASAGAWSSSSGTTLVGRTVNFNIPTVVESSESLQLTATSIGNGFGMISLSSVVPGSSNTAIGVRQMQILANTTNAFQAVWEIVPGAA